MEISVVIRVLGVIVLLLGIVAVSNPELVIDKPVPEDTYEAIERRIWWGLLIGVGLLLLLNNQWSPWLPTLLITLAALTIGLLLARLLGIVLDGSVLKQWYWVLAELLVVAVLLWWYSNVRN